MKKREVLVNGILRVLFRMMFRIRIEGISHMPDRGPFLMIANHTSAFEGPLLKVFLSPRRVIALAKKELWNHVVTRFLMNTWESIPVDRENMDRESLQKCFEVLDRNEILAIAPEGTRNGDGRLQQGKAGVAFIAYKRHVPLIPVAAIGFEDVKNNLKKCRRTPVSIIIGEPFEIVQKEGRLSASMRQELVDEIMIRLATLMPRNMWGYYADREQTFSLTKGLSIE